MHAEIPEEETTNGRTIIIAEEMQCYSLTARLRRQIQPEPQPIHLQEGTPIAGVAEGAPVEPWEAILAAVITLVEAVR